MGEEEVDDQYLSGQHIEVHGIAILVHHVEILYLVPVGIGLFFSANGIVIQPVVKIFTGHLHVVVGVAFYNKIANHR